MATAYRPGQGLSKAAVQRLQERKCVDGGIGDVPAEDANNQWDKVLGGTGQKKKLRCGSCTRPLSEEEIAEKALVCARCSAEEEASSTTFVQIPSDELGLAIMYYCNQAAATSWPAKQDKPSKSSGSHDAPLPKATPAVDTVADGISMASIAASRGIVPLTRGASICASSLMKSVPKGNTSLGVLSLNLLADCYVRVEGQPWNAFAYCDDAHLAWESRLPQLLQMLKASAADVICLQEVVVEKRALPAGGGAEEWRLPAWTDALQGYTGVLLGLKQKEWDKQAERNMHHTGRSTPTGVATFYNTERFEECAASKHGSGSGITVFLKCRDAVEAGGAALEVAVANIHLVGDPSKSDEHLKALNSLKKNLGKQSLRIVCGDFNGECKPGSEVAEWFDQEGFAEVPTGTSWAEPGKAQRLDHIFATKALRLIAASGDLSDSEAASGLPCASCPSDHAPVAAFLSGVLKGRCPW